MAVAIASSDEGLFLIQDEQGCYTLPHVSAKKKGQARLCLEELLGKDHYQARLLRELAPMYMRHGHEFITVVPYLAEFGAYPKKDGQEIPYLFADEKKEYHFQMDPYLAALIRRSMIYLPYYQGRKRGVPLFEEEQKKVDFLLAATKYFARRIPTIERYDFLGLCASPASLKRIEAAFNDMLEHNQLKIGEYVRYLQYKEDLRKALEK